MPTEQEVERIVHENAGLIRLLVGRTTRLFTRLPGGYEREDLESFAYIGLVRAAHTYDATRGVAFSTYAFKCIQNAIRGELERARTQVQDENGRTIEWFSLDNPIGEDDDTTLADQYEDPGLNAEELVVNQSETEILQQAIKHLPTQMAHVVWDVYFVGLPIAEVARNMRLSPQRVQVLHAKALKMLRRRLRGNR